MTACDKAIESARQVWWSSGTGEPQAKFAAPAPRRTHGHCDGIDARKLGVFPSAGVSQPNEARKGSESPGTPSRYEKKPSSNRPSTNPRNPGSPGVCKRRDCQRVKTLRGDVPAA